jgi:hypothetical protein
VKVVFASSQPMVDYRVNVIDVLLSENEYFKLQGTAEFLNMMEGHLDEVLGYQDNPQNTPADMFRDAFVENSQKLFTQSTQGMKSALAEMGSIVNIQQKLDIVRGGYKTISKFIPDADLVLAAEQEALNFAAQQQRHRGAQPPPNPPRGQPTMQQGNRDRPQSILGGIFGRLATSVTLPEEEDSKQQPLLYHREERGVLHNPPAHSFPRPAVKTQQPPIQPPQQQQIPKPEPTRQLPLPPSRHHAMSDPDDAIDHKPPKMHEVMNNTAQGPQSTTFTLQPSVDEPKAQQNSTDWNKPIPTQTTASLDMADLSEPRKEDVQDGWDIDDTDGDILLDREDELTFAKPEGAHDEETMVTMPQDFPAGKGSLDVQSPPGTVRPPVVKRQLIADVDYSPEDDIIETRKRWINPRSLRPHLFI